VGLQRVSDSQGQDQNGRSGREEKAQVVFQRAPEDRVGEQPPEGIRCEDIISRKLG